ncbi:MAG: nicotinate phosphoribosyltransferase [Candidatus Micrarchaeales archaeon]|jgi:nicotinate phosphoribosyltransferase
MKENNSLKTDLYQLTMAAGYVREGMADTMSTFDLFIRRLPETRNYLLISGIEESLNYLESFRFDADQISYLKSLPSFSSQEEIFFNKLESLRFRGDVWAVREGTPLFAKEPIIVVRAPIIEAQLVETYLENVIGSQTMFASKASRIFDVAAPKTLIEFGTRRSHDPEAAIACARASYIAGFEGSSNVEAGKRYGIPAIGTMAHSFVMSFDSELEAFRSYAKTFPKNTVLLVDTYDTEAGIRNAITVAKEMESRGEHLRGVRIDSGDLSGMSKLARKLFDEAKLKDISIFLSSDLDEIKIAQLKRDGADCQMYAVGTMLSTSSDAPNLPIVYKLAEHETAPGVMTPCIKVSEGKTTLPGLKQVYRHSSNSRFTRDEICLATERRPDARPLLEKVMEHGKIIARMPTINETREYATDQRNRLPSELRGLEQSAYTVEVSHELSQLQAVLVKEITERTTSLNKRRVIDYA